MKPLCLIVLAILLGFGTCQAHTDNTTLAGVGTIAVVVQVTGPASDVSIEQQALQSRVERTLRSAHISLADGTHPAIATLLITVNILKLGDSGNYVCTTLCELNELCKCVSRPGQAMLSAITWIESQTGSGPQSKINDGAKDAIDECIDDYSNDYLADNPAK